MKRLIDETVFSGLTAAWRRASCPTRRSPDFVKATTDGVVREPSEFGMTTGSPPSMTAMTELVVPRSIPTVFGMFLTVPPDRAYGANSMSTFGLFPGSSASKRSVGACNPRTLEPMPIFELDPVDQIAIAAVGQPGQRQFFLMAKGHGRTLTLTCEKAQIQALIVRLHQMMEAQGIEVSERAPGNAGLAPGEPEWQVGELGLGYHEARRMFVLVASQSAVGEAAPATSDEAPSVRFWLSHQQ